MTITHTEARQLVQKAFNGDLRAVSRVLRGLIDGDFVPRSPPVVHVPDEATYVVLAANTGKLHIMPDLTSDCTIDLPTPVDGLEFRFQYGGGAADAQDWIFDTMAAANFYIGGVAFLDTDAGDTADEVHLGVYSDGNSNDIFTVLTPAAGTLVHFVCDGTNWYVNGTVFSATVPTFADT